MTRDYTENSKKAIAANKQGEAQTIAAAFRKKVLTYLDGVLASAGGAATEGADHNPESLVATACPIVPPLVRS